MDKKHRHSGHGLLEVLDDLNVMEYDPYLSIEDWSLSEEEEAMFDGLGAEDEIKIAKDTYLKLRGPTLVNSMSEMARLIRCMWFDDATRKADIEFQAKRAEIQAIMFSKICEIDNNTI